MKKESGDREETVVGRSQDCEGHKVKNKKRIWRMSSSSLHYIVVLPYPREYVPRPTVGA